MKRLLLATLFALTTSALASESSVSVTAGEVGFYGRIDIGDSPHPELLFAQPLIVKPRDGVERAAIYLHVPVGHAKAWSKHCRKYDACGEPVFFVHERWYNDVYVPHQQKKSIKRVKRYKSDLWGRGKSKRWA